jgi:uncharacterized membrane protein
LLFFLLVLFPAFRSAGLGEEERRTFLGRGVPRFSRLALASVLALGITGTYNLAIQSTDLPAIASSLYGQVVGLKVVLFGALIVIGAINLAYLSPRLGLLRAEAAEGTVSKFRRNVRLEAALMVIIILCAGGLTLLPPPTSGATAPSEGSPEQSGLTLPTALAFTPAATAPVSVSPVTATTAIAGTFISLEVERADAGEVFSVTLSGEASVQPDFFDVTRVNLSVSPQSAEAGSTVLQAERSGEPEGTRQVWASKAGILGLEGSYLVTVVAQRTVSPDLKAAFWLTVAADRVAAVRPIQYVEARFSTSPEPPVVGRVRIVVAMRGAMGEPLSDDRLALRFSSTGPGDGRNVVEPQLMQAPGEEGQYSTEVVFPVAGPWILHVYATREGQPDLKFTASIDVLDLAPSSP